MYVAIDASARTHVTNFLDTSQRLSLLIHMEEYEDLSDHKHPVSILLAALNHVKEVFRTQQLELLRVLRDLKSDDTVSQKEITRARREAFGAKKNQPENGGDSGKKGQPRASRVGPKHATSAGRDHLRPQATVSVCAH